MRNPIPTPSIVNRRALSSYNRRQTRRHPHRNSSPPHLRPYPPPTLQSADARPPRLLPSRPPLPPVHLRSLLLALPRPVAPSARRALPLPLLPSLPVQKQPAP